MKRVKFGGELAACGYPRLSFNSQVGAIAQRDANFNAACICALGQLTVNGDKIN